MKWELEESLILSQALESENAALKKEVEYLKKREEVLIHENKKLKEIYKEELERQNLDVDQFKISKTSEISALKE